MITQIFKHSTAPTGKLDIPALEGLNELSLKFDTTEARDEFCSQFPKSMKVYCGWISGSILVDGHYECARWPYARLYTASTINSDSSMNKATGEVNETGNKKMKRFYDAVVKQLEMEATK